MCKQNYKTNELNEIILRCEGLEEFKEEILQSVSNQKKLWVEKINEIILQNSYTKMQMAELCGVSRITINKWCKGAVPKNRETFIRIGFAAKYNLEEMNNFLKRYGRYPELYAKSLEDCVCIFILSSDGIPHTYEKYNEILSLIKKEMYRNDVEAENEYETSGVFNDLLFLETEDELIRFVNRNSKVFQTQFRKFYAYVEAFLQLNCYNEVDETIQSTHFLANGQSWTSSLRHCVSAIHQKKWYPMRNKIISLGLHLNMDIEQINEMFRLAHMEKLYANNPLESAIIYAVENAKLEGMVFMDGTDELCVYVKKVLKELSIPDMEFFLNELPEEIVSEEV